MLDTLLHYPVYLLLHTQNYRPLSHFWVWFESSFYPFINVCCRSVVFPLALDFQPDVILVSAGFNATEGHPPTLGGYSVSPECYAHLTRLLMTVCNGKVVMALEGG